MSLCYLGGLHSFDELCDFVLQTPYRFQPRFLLVWRSQHQCAISRARRGLRLPNQRLCTDLLYHLGPFPTQSHDQRHYEAATARKTLSYDPSQKTKCSTCRSSKLSSKKLMYLLDGFQNLMLFWFCSREQGRQSREQDGGVQNVALQRHPQ